MPADPDQLVDLTTASSETHAAIIAAALKDRGIPTVPVGTAGSVLQWEIAATAPFRVQVRRCDAERALALLAEIKDDSIDPDSPTVESGDTTEPHERDFGQRIEIALCAKCGYNLRGLPPPFRCPECGNIDPELNSALRCVICGTDLTDAPNQTDCPTCSASARGGSVAVAVGQSSHSATVARLNTAEEAHHVRRFLKRALIESEVVAAVDHSPTTKGRFAIEVTQPDRAMAHSALLFAYETGYPISASSIERGPDHSFTFLAVPPADWFTQCDRCGHKHQPGHRTTQCQRCGSDRVSYVHPSQVAAYRKGRKHRLYLALGLTAAWLAVIIGFRLSIN